MTQFEDKFMEIQIDMVSLAMEYVQNQADKIFIYCVADGFYSFDVFFKTNNHYLDRDEIAGYLPNEIDSSDEIQFSLLTIGAQDIERMVKICQEYGREHPTEMWLIYDAQKNSLDSRYSYEGRYDKNEELLPRLEFEKWFEEVKKSTQA